MSVIGIILSIFAIIAVAAMWVSIIIVIVRKMLDGIFWKIFQWVTFSIALIGLVTIIALFITEL